MLRRWRKSDGAAAVARAGGGSRRDAGGDRRAEHAQPRAGVAPRRSCGFASCATGQGIALVADAARRRRFAEPAAEPPPLGDQSRVRELDVGRSRRRGPAQRDAEQRLPAGPRPRESGPGRPGGRSDRAGDGRALGPRRHHADGLYDELAAEGGFEIVKRDWIEEAGGILAADSPRLLFETLDLFEEAGIPALVEAYLGEPPAISAQKFTLRKATPDVGGAWHQDGGFLGDVRSLNLWVSLSRCGDVAPSMDVVPQRLDGLVETGGEGTWIAGQISTGNGGAGGGRSRRRAADLRSRRRTLVRRAVPAPDGDRRGDAEPALRDRDLVLRSIRLCGRQRAAGAVEVRPPR